MKKGKKLDTKKAPLFPSFTTRKDAYPDGREMNRNKLYLYHRYSCQEIEEELLKYNIHIQSDEVLKLYEESYNINLLIQLLQLKYQKESKELDKLGILLDVDVFLFYSEKLIQNHYDVATLPDPYWIYQTLDKIKEEKKSKKCELFIKVCQAINKIQFYTEERSIDSIFQGNRLMIDDQIEELLGIDIHNCFPETQTIDIITNEICRMLSTYQLRSYSSAHIYSDIIDLNAQSEKADSLLKEGLKKYPEYRYLLYSSLICALKDKEKQKQYYNECLAIPCQSAEEEEYKGIMYDWINETFKD